MHDGGGAPGSGLMRLTLTVGSLAARAPWWGFALLTLGIGVLRTGPLGIGPEWVGWLRSAGQTLPEPGQYLSSSVGPAAVMRLVGSPSDPLWWVIGGVLWVGVFAVPILLLSRKGVRGRSVAIGVAASPALAVALTVLGHYDPWMVAGSAVVALSRRWWYAHGGHWSPQLATRSKPGRPPLPCGLWPLRGASVAQSFRPWCTWPPQRSASWQRGPGFPPRVRRDVQMPSSALPSLASRHSLGGVLLRSLRGLGRCGSQS